MKNEKGVTLVALVVTIIVLIILAGISINLVLGDNGIITIAKKAKENTELARVEEETELNELYTQLESSGTSSGGTNYDAIAKLTEFKKAIATAINEAGGLKTENTAETNIFVNNIKGIVKEVTKDATATANDIAKGKTAWVNGECITGLGVNSNIPASGTLLWTNPSPSTAFASQTITIENSDNYRYIQVDSIGGSTVPLTSFSTQIYKNNTSNALSSYYTDGYISTRLMKISGNNITFNTGFIGQSNKTSSDNYCIPLRIYGLN